ncbi:hypothetical protein JRQ81_012408 [Phrynocephalus forsythii]|uniref:C2H2-type domain-containing protein n=1 Tax=Phrynocephalus forsythii TaxID=171643 RepID=A0A9Q0Y110_9SAUR|nr:hypothetical protein JRQ81_012408 [Phrynocephalus forsythii]
MDFKLAESDQSTGSGPQTENKHTCDICEKSFKFAGTLTRHKKAHVREDRKDEKSSEDESKNAQAGAQIPVTLEDPSPDQEEHGRDIKGAESPTDGEATGKENEECESTSEGEGAEKKSSEKSDDDRKPKAAGGAKSESKADKRKKVCTVCNKRFWSLQDLTRHMRSHTGRCGRWLVAIGKTRNDHINSHEAKQHSLVRHQRIHQKLKTAKSHEKESDREDARSRGEEDSENDSLHSSANPVSENECDSLAGPGSRSPVTRSRKESLANAAKDAVGKDDRPAVRTAALALTETTSRNATKPLAKDQESPLPSPPPRGGKGDRGSPSGFIQDLLEIHNKKAPMSHILASAESAPQLLGVE